MYCIGYPLKSLKCNKYLGQIRLIFLWQRKRFTYPVYIINGIFTYCAYAGGGVKVKASNNCVSLVWDILTTCLSRPQQNLIIFSSRKSNIDSLSTLIENWWKLIPLGWVKNCWVLFITVVVVYSSQKNIMLCRNQFIVQIKLSIYVLSLFNLLSYPSFLNLKTKNGG